MDQGELNKTVSTRDVKPQEGPFMDDEDDLLRILINQLMSDVVPEELSTYFVPKRIINKSEDEAAKFFAEGKQALTTEKYENATAAFTRGLIMIPKSSTKIAEYYIERSIALQKLKAFTESLQDIERALQLKISKEQREELKKREEVLKALNSSLRSKELNLKDNSKEKIRFSKGENREIKGVSKTIKLQYNNKFGRHYVTTQNIKVGDLLMVQKPFVSVPSELYGNRIMQPGENKWTCDYCLSLIVAPIPCDNCVFCVYCSLNCQSNAYRKYHKIECKILKFVPSSRDHQVALYLRTMLIATEQGEKFHDTVTTMEKIKNATDRREVGFKNGKFDGCSPDAVLSLLTHRDKRKIRQFTGEAAILSTVLKKHTDFLKGNNLDDVFKLGQLITHLNYVCYTNLDTIKRYNDKNVIATCVHPAFSLLNHSCACNTLTYDDENGNKILRACRNIKKGKQVYVSYFGFAKMKGTTEHRRTMLKGCLLFNCECECCEKNYKYTMEVAKDLKVPCSLQTQLLDKPYDIENLWKFLKIILDGYKGLCLETKEIEEALINAYLGGKNEELPEKLEKLFFFVRQE